VKGAWEEEREGGMMAGEEETRRKDQAEQPRDQTELKTGSTGAWSFYLVRIAILSVTIAFIVVMVLFAFLDVFNSQNAANITAALGSLFGVVGTLVGAYFGIKASSDAQDSSATTAKQAVESQRATSTQSGEKILDAAKTAKQPNPQSNPTTAPQRAPGPNPMSWALAMLIPVAGCAGLLVLQNYLRRMRDAA
jgi:hypothetical protein